MRPKKLRYMRGRREANMKRKKKLRAWVASADFEYRYSDPEAGLKLANDDSLVGVTAHADRLDCYLTLTLEGVPFHVAEAVKTTLGHRGIDSDAVLAAMLRKIADELEEGAARPG